MGAGTPPFRPGSRLWWPGGQRDGAGVRGGWARRRQELGTRGVVLPTSMDGDVTLAGYDLALTRLVADAVDLPVIASGGAGSLEHFYWG